MLLILIPLAAGGLAFCAGTARAQQPNRGAPAPVVPPADPAGAVASAAHPPLKSAPGAPLVRIILPNPAAPSYVLYDQINNASAYGSSSQQFEPASAAYNDQAADDFTVPSGQNWQITEVDVQGYYFSGNGPAASFNVYFYSSVASGTYAIPGAAVYTATAQSYVNTAGIFAITLTSPPVLYGSATNYFVSVQAVQDLSPGGQWAWQNRTVTAHSGAAWRNPGGGFGPACQNWDRRAFCLGDGAAPDQLFRLVGNYVGGPTPTPTATPCPLNYTVSTGTATIITGTQDIGNHCDDCVTTVPFPFDVTFYGQTYSSATASSNGNLQFLTNSPRQGATCPLPDPNFGTTILLYQSDLDTSTSGGCPGGCGIYTATLGVAPNRRFVIEWRTSYVGQSGFSNEEIIFDEGSPVITTIYGTNADGGVQEESGVQRTGFGQATQYSCNTASLSAGLSVLYTPSSPCAGTATATPPLPTATTTRTMTLTPINTSTATPLLPNTSTATPVPSRTATPPSTPTQPPTQTPTVVPPTATSTPPASGTGTIVVPTSTPVNPATPTQTTTPGPATPSLTPTLTVCPITFQDVPPGDPFYAFIRCLTCRALLSGYPCGGSGEPCGPSSQPYFRPTNPATRGQIAKSLSNAAGFSEAVPSSRQTFADVPPGSTFWVQIERLAARGTIGGYPCGSPAEPCSAPGNRPYFRPNTAVTRGQLAKMTALTAGWTETPTAQTFEDVPVGSSFYVTIERLAVRGVIAGYPCGGPGEPCSAPGNRPYFRPGVNITRAQTAKIIANSFFPNCQTPVGRGLPPSPLARQR
jgi:hypothetical protein